MKKLFARHINPRYAGFTLVELLVVIAIIAILAAVTMNIGITVLNIAKRTKAQNTLQQIQTAALSYYTEYSVYPTVSGASAADYVLDDTDSASNWGNLTECLSGMICPSTGLASSEVVFSNTRQIAFLSLKATDVGSGTGTPTYNKDAPINPLPYSTAHPYFNLAFDADYDGILGVSPSAVTTMPNFTTTPFTSTAAAGGGSSTAGIAGWANCNPQGGTTAANWYIHTY